MAGEKTGALFECSLSLGAMLGGASEDVSRGLGRCGYLAGIAFQLQDDALGFLRDDMEEIGLELMRRKKSFPIFCALERQDLRESILELYRQPSHSPEDAARLLLLLRENGILDQVLAIAVEYYRQAEEELDDLKLPYDAELKEIIIFLRGRQT
jgi:geranylgeranyl diphosphate synthase type I